MKILHTSDLHIGSPLTTHLSGERAALRRREIGDTLRKIIDTARAYSATAVIIAGDLFDSERVSRREMARAVGDIGAAADIDFYYLPGNHEGEALFSVGALPSNLYIFGREWTYFKSGDITIVGRSETEADMFDALSVSGKTVAVLHGEVRAASARGGVIGPLEAANKGITYLALGHYHSYSSLPIDSLGVAVYSGTPEGRGFDECGECGAVLIDTDSPFPYHKFIKTASRTLHSLKVSVEGAKDSSEIEAALLLATRELPSSDIVRATLVGRTLPSAWVDTAGLSGLIMSRFFHSELIDETGVRINPTDYDNDPTLRGELVRSVTSDTSLSELDKEKIIATALAALDGEAYFGV